MKKLLISILYIFIFITAFSQNYPVINRTFGTNTVNDPREMHTKNLFIPAYDDSTQASLPTNIGIDSCGAIFFSRNNGNVYVRKCSPVKYWAVVGVGGSSTNTSIGSGIKIAVNGTNNIKSITATNALTADSSTSGQVGFKFGGTGIENTTVAWSTFTQSQTWTNLGANSGFTLTQNGTGTGNSSGVGNAVLRIVKQGALSIGQTTTGAYITNDNTGSGGQNVALRLNSTGKVANSYALIVDSGYVGIGENLPGSKLWIRANNSHEFPDYRSGIVMSNDSSATPTYVQVSPSYMMNSQGWDIDGAISVGINMGFYSRPISANTVGATLQFITSLSSFTAASPPTNIMGMGSAGQFYNASGSAGTANQVLVSGGASAQWTWVDQSALSIPINSISAATGSSTPDHANNTVAWQWNSLTGNTTSFQIFSNSILLTGTTSELFRVAQGGANNNASITSTTANFLNQKSGTTSTNIAASFVATNATNNYAIIVPSGSGRVGFGTSAPAVQFHSVGTARLASLGTALFDTTTYKPLGIDASGNLLPITSWPGGGGVTTMAAIGSSPNANGATISGVTLTLQPASGSFGGVLTTSDQTVGAGRKTFTGQDVHSNGISITGARSFADGLVLEYDAGSNLATILAYSGGDKDLRTITNTTTMYGGNSNPGIIINTAGRVGIGTSTASDATARLWLPAGAAAASSAPLKFTSGTNLTTPEAGAMEFNGSNLYFTPTGTIRKTIATNIVSRSVAQNAAVATVATQTVGAADASYIVSANVLVTTATAHSFNVTVSYTDDGNTSRTITLNFSTLAGVISNAAITNVAGAVPYEGVPLHIRAKASTTITIATTGTFTTVVYNVEGRISQIN